MVEEEYSSTMNTFLVSQNTDVVEKLLSVFQTDDTYKIQQKSLITQDTRHRLAMKFK